MTSNEQRKEWQEEVARINEKPKHELTLEDIAKLKQAEKIHIQNNER